ncbi:MAG TPA: hypothetical protein VGS41_02155, partial [Chthonomonadales bacterium]|nr:hypothetical protein [Chthonomonadales bacterium]
MNVIASDVPVDLEVLDADDNAVSRVRSVLRYLYAERAVLAIQPGKCAPCLHWGARVRFCVDQEDSCFELVGTVLAHELSAGTRSGWREEGGTWPELLLGLRDCRRTSQRRAEARRHLRLPVQYREAAIGAAPADGADGWLDGWCVDVSCA